MTNYKNPFSDSPHKNSSDMLSTYIKIKTLKEIGELINISDFFDFNHQYTKRVNVFKTLTLLRVEAIKHERKHLLIYLENLTRSLNDGNISQKEILNYIETHSNLLDAQ